MRTENLQLDADYTQIEYQELEIAPVVPVVTPTGSAVLTINGTITGPSVTFSGGTSGFSYAAAGTTTLNLVSALTTKGDIYTWSTSGQRLAVGSNGQVLTADSAQATGIKWATPTTGTVTVVGGGSLTSTALVTGGGSQALQTPSATSTLDSSGNLFIAGNAGFGTTSISSLGDTANGTTASVAGSAAYGLLQLTKSTTGTGSSGRISFGSPAYTGADKRHVAMEAVSTTAVTDNPSGRLIIYTNNVGTLAERMRINETGNVKIAGTAIRATTEGTNHLDIFNGTAPVGTLTNGVSLYSSAGECYVMDAGGTATLISPHRKGYWVHDEKNAQGRRLVIDVEKMLRFLNNHFGADFVHEWMEAT